jgi:arylsulfatase A-like enzyme
MYLTIVVVNVTHRHDRPTTRKVAAAGTRFTTAYVPAAVCAPSRSCLASGREYDHAGVRNNGFDFPVNETTFYMVLRQRGYHVMTTGTVLFPP